MPTLPLLTRRNCLISKSSLAGVHWVLAVEAVATTAIEHPEWDMGETKTWAEWEEQ